jgi:amino acid permease
MEYDRESLLSDYLKFYQNFQKDGAGIATTSFGIMKNIVGSGIVCLPQAMLYGSIIPCILMTSSIFLISTYSFFLIGKLCIDNESKSYKDLWNKAFNKKYGWIVDAAILSNCVCGSVTLISDRFCREFYISNDFSYRQFFILIFIIYIEVCYVILFGIKI